MRAQSPLRAFNTADEQLGREILDFVRRGRIRAARTIP
jgi:hypothetical protein